VEGLVDGRMARLGRAEFVGSGLVAGGETELWFAREGETAVRFCFSDRLRPDAAATVETLKGRGFGVEILSGDLEGPVRRTAEALGVAAWRAGLTPEDKAARIDALAAEGCKVLMVGDGLNDAAALARAHASLAPGSAADASQSAADLVFESDRLMPVVEAIVTARRARRRALENFALSGAYNLIAAPLAIAGLATPLVAAVAMSASSLVVMLNALRLNLPGGATWRS
jgi:Cu2+-exporting ATPase